MIEPLVSICCITYNQEGLIVDAIESFLMQRTTFPIEILIGEDCSTDGTEKIVREYERLYPGKVRLFVSEQNIGGMRNLQNLIKNVKGRYIALCEGDDYWLNPDKLQKQVDVLEQSAERMMCFHGAKVVNARKIPLGKIIRPFNEEHQCTTEEIIRIAGSGIPTPSKLYRRKALENPPDWYLNAHVGDMASDLLLASKGKVIYIDEIMSAYRMAVKGSWSRRLYSGPDILNKKIEMMEKDIALYESFNAATQYEYNQVISHVNQGINLGIALISIKGFRSKIEKSKAIIQHLGIKRGCRMVAKYCLLMVLAYYQKWMYSLRRKTGSID